MDATKIKLLEDLIRAGRLVEQCQTLALITSDERAEYFKTLKAKVSDSVTDLLKP